MSLFSQAHDHASESQSLNEIKVVFLGDGDTGKSHTISRLMNDGGEPGVVTGISSPGVVVQNKQYTQEGRQICVRYWDFGGQEILHSLHRIFFTGQTMYVVFLNAREGNLDERAKYWLNGICGVAPGAPVILVLNKIDLAASVNFDEEYLLKRYDNLRQVVKLSSLAFSRKEFNECFTDVLFDEIWGTGILDTHWPASWFRVKEKLESMESNYIMGRDYYNICRECGVEDDPTDLLGWLHDLGICFWCTDLEYIASGDYVVLRPNWILNALHIILFNSKDGPHSGLLPHSIIFHMLGNAYRDPNQRCALPGVRYTAGEVGYILNIMHRFYLSIPAGNENEYIPMICQQGAKVHIESFRRNPDTLEFYMEFEHVPYDLLPRLMAKRAGDVDWSSVWSNGAILQSGYEDLSTVISIDKNVLSIIISNKSYLVRTDKYLETLVEDVEGICAQMKLLRRKQEIVYKQDGKRDVFDYDTLRLKCAIGEQEVFSRVFRKKISIDEILNQSALAIQKERAIVSSIADACTQLQSLPLPFEEDEINLCLKTFLLNSGYIIADQALLNATSPRGMGSGEPDLYLMDRGQHPLTVIETMKARAGFFFMRSWDEHLTKLLHHYNPQGLTPLFLICYTDCEKNAYEGLWNRWRDHCRRYSPDRSEQIYDSYTEYDIFNPYLRMVSCRYLLNRKEIKVYHCFVRVETARSEKQLPQQKPADQPEPSGTDLKSHPQAEKTLQDYRVVFLGDSEAGKTLLLSRVDQPEMDPKSFDKDTTIGINIIRKEETINGQPVRLNYWDFGGQDILHSMHRIFLAKNTLYVIVLNTRNDNQDAQAIFWLRYVEAYAPGSPVLLVMNKIDQNKRAALNLPVLRRLFSPREITSEDVLKISAVLPDQEKFRNEFTRKLHACVGRHLTLDNHFSEQQLRIRDKVEEKKAADKLKVISIDDFRDICEEEGLDEEKAQDLLMERFNEAGVLVYFQSKTLMIMNPEWITKTIYKILDQDEQIADNGVVVHKKIRSFCRKNNDHINKSEDAAYLVDIMRDYDLSFQYEKHKPGEENTEDKEFIPMLCQREEPEDIETLIKEDNTVQLRMVFEYLPCGVLYKLMVDHHKLEEADHGGLDMAHVWRSGMKLDGENGAYAVVRQEGNTMGIYVHDGSISRAVDWMTDLMTKTEEAAEHDKFNAVLLEKKIGYQIAGVLEYFDYQQLKNAEEKGVYYTVSRKLPPQKVAIQDILSQKDGTVIEKIKELLKLTSEGCQELQGRHTFWFLNKEAKDDRLAPKMDEDSRTAELKTVLRSKFTVKDQPRWGDSGGGVKQGELDLWIGIDEHTPIAILEALNISTSENGKSVASWKEHLERMMCNYNKNGFKNLLLVSYLDCPLEDLVQTRREYFNRMRDYHVPCYGAPKYCEPIVVDEFSDGIHVVRADYSSGAGDVTVYHFLVRIEQYGRKKAEKEAIKADAKK